jgi:pimeloyl-ACP methyl ester carboxylesterase
LTANPIRPGAHADDSELQLETTSTQQPEEIAMLTAIPTTNPAPSRQSSLVVALHCSGGTGRQWQHLSQALGPDFKVAAPDLIGCGTNPHWGGDKPFELTDEARSFVKLIDDWSGPIHLVGHSYGGGVALRIAVERPARITSLSLYEPTAFHVLKTTDDEGQAALEEIRALAAKIGTYVVAGSYRAAARRFVDYWSGAGTFDALKPEVQGTIVRYIPKACLDFRALIDERTPLIAYRRMRVPVQLLCGEFAPTPTALLARKLAVVMNPGALRIVPGAGHMGPITHNEAVLKAIAEHMAAWDPTETSHREPSWPLAA